MHMHMHVHHLITCFVGVEYQVNIDPEFSIWNLLLHIHLNIYIHMHMCLKNFFPTPGVF
jgi:hypothetical protein